MRRKTSPKVSVSGHRLNCRSHWCSFTALLCLPLVVSSRLEGDIVALRKFNNGLERVYIPFPKGHPQTMHRQALKGSLAAFSPHCSSCGPDGFTHLPLPQEDGHTILTDMAVCHLHSNGTLLQLAPLSQSCVPLYLQPSLISLIDPSIPFLVVCRNSCYQGVTWDGRSISLTAPTACGQSGGVFVESQGELFLVTYSDGAIDEYSFASATFYSPPLPDVHCEGSGDLYPLHGQESYLLRCNTADGPALYVISLSIHGSQVRAIQATGRPQSAPDGEHFIVVDDSSLRLYVTANETVTPQAKTFSSDITHTQFMNSRYLSLSTEGGEHVLVDIQHIFSVSAAGEAVVKLIGGPLLAMLWIDPDVYVYITRDVTSVLKMHFYNTTSGKEVEGGAEIQVVDVPDLLVFMEKSAESVTPPDDKVDDGGINPGLIVGVIIAVIAVIGLLLGMVGVSIYCYRKFPSLRYGRLSNRSATNTPGTRTPEPELPPEDEEEAEYSALQVTVSPVQETQHLPNDGQALCPTTPLPATNTPAQETQQDDGEKKPSGKEVSSQPLDSEDVNSAASLLPQRVMEPTVEGAPVTPNGGQALSPPALPGFIELVSASERNTMSWPAGQCESENPPCDQFAT